jgi:hypothetical protein
VKSIAAQRAPAFAQMAQNSGIVLELHLEPAVAS